MELPTTALVVKSAIAVLLIIGGIAALWAGYRLYRSGVGLKADGSTIETDKIKANLKTVGSVVMGTSVAWGFLGYLASPDFTSDGGTITITSRDGENYKVDVPVIKTDSPPGVENVADLTSDQVKDSFEAAAKEVQINGKPAILVGIHQYEESNRSYLVSKWEDAKGGEAVHLVFVPTIEGKDIQFRPTEISITE